MAAIVRPQTKPQGRGQNGWQPKIDPKRGSDGCIVDAEPRGFVGRPWDHEKGRQMQRLATILLLIAPHGAWAHTGHLDTLAGHDHWVAGIALGAAAGLALWGWLKGDTDDEPAQIADENEEAEA